MDDFSRTLCPHARSMPMSPYDFLICFRICNIAYYMIRLNGSLPGASYDLFIGELGAIAEVAFDFTLRMVLKDARTIALSGWSFFCQFFYMVDFNWINFILRLVCLDIVREPSRPSACCCLASRVCKVFLKQVWVTLIWLFLIYTIALYREYLLLY